MNDNNDAFADRDAFGLTADDWASFLGNGPSYYTGPALLWWALSGIPGGEGPTMVVRNPFPELLISLAAEAKALVMLSDTSQHDSVRAFSPGLKNLYRRMAAAAEIAVRLEEDKGGEHGPRPASHDALPPQSVKQRAGSLR